MFALGLISFAAGIIFMLKGAWPVFGFFGLDVLLVYIFLIHQNITAIMLIPVILVLTLIASVFVASKRENLEELNKSLLNILNIDNLK